MAPTTGIWIEIDNPVKSFFPGQTITGVVIVENEKSVETTGIAIKFEGKVKVSWSERVTRKDGRSRKIVTVFYTADETYFNHEILLWGSTSEEKQRIIMPRGRSVHEFEYTLPTDLPSSFVSRSGTVSYSMEAALRLPSHRSNAACIVPFTVNGILDLNVEPGVSLAYETRRYKSICCFCCTSGPVGFIFRMPRRGFVPGEVIEFTAELNNQSGQRVYGMKVTLMQECKFHASENSKSTVRPIRQVQGPEVGPGDSEVWIEKMLRIPPIPPSRLGNCRLIDVQYFLKLEMTLSNLTLNLKEEIPITIGTIPMRDTFANLNGSVMTLPMPIRGEMHESPSKPSLLSMSISDDVIMEEKPSAPVRTRGFSVSSEHPSFSEYPDLPPPSYQEAILLDKLPEEENPGFTPEEACQPGESNPSNADALNDNFPMHTMQFVPQYVTYGVVSRNKSPHHSAYAS